MGLVLRGGWVVDVEPAQVERTCLRIEGHRIVERGPELVANPGDEVIELNGKLLFPGLVSAHHHFHALFTRGLPRRSSGFSGELELLHQVEQVLDGDDLESASAAGGLEGLCSGTTTVFASHRAPSAIEGSLGRVAQGLNRIGLRAVLAYQMSERSGPEGREAGLAENVRCIRMAKGRCRGALGVEALAGFSDEGLERVRLAHEASNSMLLGTLAEDPAEEASSRARFGQTASQRLVERGLVGTRVVLAQGVHLAWPELSSLIAQGTWLAHAARSNMFSQAGLATASKFGIRGCLGTDVMPLDCFAEAQAASLRATDAGQPIDLLRFIANGHRLASQAFGMPIGPLQPGHAADLLVLDAHPPTPLEASTLEAHVRLGFSARWVESVMVDGSWRVWKRTPLSIDVAEVGRQASTSARAVWQRLGQGAEGLAPAAAAP